MTIKYGFVAHRPQSELKALHIIMAINFRDRQIQSLGYLRIRSTFDIYSSKCRISKKFRVLGAFVHLEKDTILTPRFASFSGVNHRQTDPKNFLPDMQRYAARVGQTLSFSVVMSVVRVVRASQ